MNLIIRKASVCWKGGANGGTRTVTTQHGVLEHPRFSFGAPLKSTLNTDPAELIAAAQAASFSLALSNKLGLKDFSAGEIVTTVTVTLKHLLTGWVIMNIHLNVLAKLPRMTQGRFIDATIHVKETCLISKLLHTNIPMHAKLERCDVPNRYRRIPSSSTRSSA